MSILLRKFIFSTLIGTILFLSMAPLLQARAQTQTTWYNQSFPEWYLKVYDPSQSPPNEIFGERYTAAQVQWIAYSLPAMIINLAVDGNTDMASCLMASFTHTVQIDVCGSAIANMINGLIGKFSLSSINPNTQKSVASQIFAERSLSGISYARSVVNKFNPVTTVRAKKPVSEPMVLFTPFCFSGRLHGHIFLPVCSGSGSVCVYDHV